MIIYNPIDYDRFYDCAVALSQNPFSIWLDSSDTDHKNSHFSFVLTDPLVKIASDIQNCLFDFLENYPLFQNDFAQKLIKEREKNPHLPPFIGGFAGFLSYDYAVTQRFKMQNIPQTINNIPKFYGGLYDCVVFANHQSKQAGIIGLDIYGGNHIFDKIKKIQNTARTLDTLTTPPEENQEKLKIPILDSKNYIQNVEKSIDYIKQGDIFQANIAHFIKLKRPSNFNSLAFYKNLRHVNASPFGCYIHDKDFQIMSASPERFLKIKDNIITAEPIKGTIKSNPDPVIDKQLRELLSNCPKNRAENMIIVDLLRNDISPHAIAGTIKAEMLCELQTFKGLHHLVSLIRAEITPKKNIIDILKMALPGGSITGAPKKRVCEIIYELENFTRGAYCGNAGYIGFDRNVDMNILIRTLQADNHSVVIHSGCGITAQSDSHQEWHETTTKMNKIFAAFNV